MPQKERKNQLNKTQLGTGGSLIGEEERIYSETLNRLLGWIIKVRY